MKLSTVSIDLAKTIFQLHGVRLANWGRPCMSGLTYHRGRNAIFHIYFEQCLVEFFVILCT